MLSQIAYCTVFFSLALLFITVMVVANKRFAILFLAISERWCQSVRFLVSPSGFNLTIRMLGTQNYKQREERNVISNLLICK